MLQRILGVVLVLAGLGGAALGVASATVWREADTVVATGRPAGDGTLVVTDPGVLGLVNSDVTVTATGPDDQPITLAVGREADVLGWVGDDAYTRITGLTDWETLGTAAVAAGAAEEEAEGEAAEEEPAVGPNPAGSDMWVAEASDTGSATLRWSDTPGRWVLLAAGVGEGAQAPTLELTWPRTVTTPYLWPGVGGGAVLVVVGLLVLLAARRRSRTEKPAAPAGRPRSRRKGADRDAPSLSTPASETSDEAPSSPFTWKPPVAPEQPEDDAAARRGPFAPVGVPAADEAQPAEEGRSGTAPVPVAGRFSRRSRASRDLPKRNPGEQTPPVVDDQPFGARPAATPFAPVGGGAAGSPAPAGPFADTSPTDQQAGTDHAPAPAASGGARLTRRELREQEEARRAAEQGGMGRRLRALTGSIPAVRSQTPPPPAPQAAEPDPSTRAGRAAAWRQAWGYDPSAAQDETTRGTDSNHRGDR